MPPPPTPRKSIDTNDDESSEDDLEKKIYELEQSGWRPPEETFDDDDDYNEVDLLSDNEEEETNVQQREEQLLAAEEQIARKLSLSSQDSYDLWSQLNQHPDNLVDYNTVFAEQIPTSPERRVRFEEAHSDTSESDSEVDEDLFPDLFIQQDQLDAGFRADIESDVHDFIDDDEDTASCWDFDADEARILMMDVDDDDDDSDDSDDTAGSSGYESDDGDTTDEEDVQLPPSTQKKEVSVPTTRRRRKQGIIQPKRGMFIMDPYKPILTVDCEKGKPDKIRIWPASKSSGQDKAFWQSYFAIESAATSRAQTPEDDSESHIDGFFDDQGKLLTDQVIGPMEAFLPFDEDEAEEEEDPLSNFVDFGDDMDEDEEEEEEKKNTDGFDLLAHLDRQRGVVGSFRRNQQIAKHVGSLPSHPALRASASESNAMQSGRRAAANTPITPLRRKKTVGARNSPITITSPTKRKRSGSGFR
ncbi:hypothetical protein AAFC00_001586 [Neodothiora populina]